jgi:preprotein translocase subunit Sec63
MDAFDVFLIAAVVPLLILTVGYSSFATLVLPYHVMRRWSHDTLWYTDVDDMISIGIILS